MTNHGNITKATYQADIKRKQAFFNRCKRRYAVAATPAERQFLKTEATRICNELKSCCKVWKNCGWGTFAWITRGYTTSVFNSIKVKNTTRSMFGTNMTNRTTTSSRRTGNRSYAKRNTWGRTNSSRNNGTRSNAARTSFIAW